MQPLGEQDVTDFEVAVFDVGEGSCGTFLKFWVGEAGFVAGEFNPAFQVFADGEVVGSNALAGMGALVEVLNFLKGDCEVASQVMDDGADESKIEIGI